MRLKLIREREGVSTILVHMKQFLITALPFSGGVCNSFASVVLQSCLGPISTVNKVTVEGSVELA